MSIESQITDLISSIKELTETIKGGMSGKATVASGAATKDDKEKPADKPTRTRASTAKAKLPTQADVKKAAEAFLDEAGNNEKDYNGRRAWIKDIVAKFEAPKMTEIAEDDRQAAIDMLKDYSFEEDEGEKEDDDI